MLVAVAEVWVADAKARISANQPSHMAAAIFYEKAIQTFREIPHLDRAASGVDKRIAELRTDLRDSNKRALGEMGTVTTPSMDITDIVETSRGTVQGKTAVEALKALANLHRGVDMMQLKENAIKSRQKHPLQSLFASTMLSRDGRVVAKHQSANLGGDATNNDEVSIRAQMIRDFSLSISLLVQGCVLPALEAMLLEHRLSEADFINLAMQSPIVPIGRQRLFGKALFAGYDRDFIAALHLLTPQIEHMVRVRLKQAGAKTSTLDPYGIETENGLSTLIDLPEVSRVFGDDLAFEMRALFCDPFGPNLRNEVAHGLIDDDGCHSASVIYVWWFSLRIVFNTY